VPAKQVSIRSIPWQVVVYRDSRVVQLWKERQLLLSGKVAVGAPGMETPTGLYYVTVRFKPVQVPFLGSFAFERAIPLRPRLGDDPRGRWHINFAARAQF